MAAAQRGPERPASPRAWLMTAVRRLALDSWRAETARRRREREIAKQRAIPSTEQAVEREATRRRVTDVVLALPEPWRTALVLRYFEDLPPAKIATHLGIPLDTVRSRIKRGLELVRQRLDEEYGSRRAWCLALTQLAGPSALTVGASFVGSAAAAAVLIAIGFLIVRTAGLPEAPHASEPANAPRAEAVAMRGLAGSEGLASVDSAEGSMKSELSGDAHGSGPSADRGAITVALTWPDGEPASGVRMRLAPSWSSTPTMDSLEAVSGIDGRCNFHGLPSQTYRLLFDRRSAMSLELKKAEHRTEAIQLEPGINISVRVVNAAGEPLAKATIEATTFDRRSFAIATTGGDGRAAVRCLDPDKGALLGASADGYEPSRITLIHGSVGSNIDLTLVLERRGGALRGIVVDEAGTPISGARIEAGPTAAWTPSFSDPDSQFTAPPRTAQTDTHGRFHLLTLPMGINQVLVRSKDHELWMESYTAAADDSEELRICMRPATEIAGRVLQESSAPAARVEVAVEGKREIEQYSTITDRDGRFRIRGVAAGVHRVHVWSDELGDATELITVERGEVTPWNPTLSAGCEISGFVRYGGGLPLSSCFVEAVPADESIHPGPRRIYQTQTNREGHFLIRRLLPKKYHLHVSPARRELSDSVVVREVQAPSRSVEVDVPENAVPNSAIRGRVVDAQGLPISDALITRIDPGAGMFEVHHAEPKTGQFRIPAFAVESVFIEVSASAKPGRRVGPLMPRRGETLEVGDILLDEGGSAEIAVVGLPPGAHPEIGIAPSVDPTHIDGQLLWEPSTQRASLREKRASGEYVVFLTGEQIAATAAKIRIEAGKTTHTTLTARPGSRSGLLITAPACEDTAEVTLSLQVTDSAGTLLLQERVLATRGIPWTPGVVFAPGSYRFVATAGKLRAEGEFAIPAGGQAPMQEITLR